MHLRLLTIGILFTTLAIAKGPHLDQPNDVDASYGALVAEMDALDTGRTAIELMVSLSLNLTRPGKPRGGKKTLPRGLLEARQTAPQCTVPGQILVCPITERSPCCDPAFPVCCHDPSDTCCPTGTFCTGLVTCCVNGAVGCAEGCCQAGISCCNGVCCPNATYTCGTVSGVSTCVQPTASGQLTPSQTSAATAATTAASTAAGATGASDSYATPSATATSTSSSPNNTPIIAGAVGGGVGAILLIGLLAWFILRKKSPKTEKEAVTQPTPYTNGQIDIDGPPDVVTPPYHDASTPPLIHKGNHPWNGQTASAPPSGYGYMTTPYATSSVSGASPPPPPGSSTGLMGMTEAAHTGVVGPGGYVPPPPEDVPTTSSPGTNNYYSAAPMFVNNPGPGYSSYAPSRQDTSSPSMTQYSTAPWAAGLASPSPEQQPQQQPGQHPWTAGVSSLGHDQQQQQQQQQPLWAQPAGPSRVSAISPPPGPMSPPPPPFTPAPPGYGGEGVTPFMGSNSGDGGRQVPMTAPGDRKARPSGGG